MVTLVCSVGGRVLDGGVGSRFDFLAFTSITSVVLMVVMR